MIERSDDTQRALDEGDSLSPALVRRGCDLALRRRRRSGGAARASVRICGGALAALALVILLVGSLVYVRLALGPMGLNELNPYIQQALRKRLGPSYVVKLGGSSVRLGASGPALSIQNLSLASAAGQPILQAPKAEVAVSPVALLFGSVRPTNVEVYGVTLRVVRLADGSAALSVAGAPPIVLSRLFGSKTARAGAAAGAVEPAPPTPMAWLGATLAGALDQAFDSHSPLAALQRAGVAQGRLVFEDQVSGQTLVFTQLQLAFAKTSDGAELTLAANSPTGRWALAAREQGAPGAPRALTLSAKGLSADELALAAGRRDLGFDLDSSISAQAHMALRADGTVAGASGTITVGPGFFRLHDPDFEPVKLTQVLCGFHWNSTKNSVDVKSLRLDVDDGTHIQFAGSVSPPEQAGGAWSADFSNVGPAVVGGYRPQDKPIDISQLSILARYRDASNRLSIERFEMAGPDLQFSMTGGFGGPPGAPKIVINGTAGPSSLRSALRLWPSFLAAPARSWLIDHVEGGTLRGGEIALALTDQDLANLKIHRAPADADSHIEFAVSGAAISFIPGVPPLTDLDGSGTVTGHTVTVKATSGDFLGTNGHKVALLDGLFSVPDSDPKPAPAVVQAHLGGSLDAVADIIGRKGLKPYGGGVPIDTNLLSGQVDARLTIDTKLGKLAKASDTSVTATAKVADFTIKKIIGTQRIEQANLAVTVDGGGLRASGEGRLLGAPATIDLDRPSGPGSITSVIVATTLDGAARAKLGFGTSNIQGPVGARFSSTLGQKGSPSAQVELDLTRASIKDLAPGFLKPAGRPAKADFDLSQGPDGIDVNQFAFDSGSSFARGYLRLDSKGALQSIHFTKARLSPGDDLSVDVSQTEQGLKISVRGPVLDARPFLHAFSTGGSDGQPLENIDLDVKCALVTGANDEAISNLMLRIVKRDGVLRQFQLAGRFGRQALVGEMIRNAPKGPPQISVTSGDAGSLLSFTDLYKRVEGGVLSLAMAVGDNSIAGRLTIHSFVIRDEPSLQRILTESAAEQARERARINTSSAQFTKLQVDFSRRAGRVVLRDGSMFGPNIGTTLQGWLDFARNRVNLTGTFVPAYGLNNLFSQVPVFGLLLGGGAHEGLFGVNYRISGAANAPVLTINPLSAIAPGFLRKVFGALDNAVTPADQ